MDREKIASELVAMAEELMAGDGSVKVAGESMLEFVIARRDLYGLKNKVDDQTWKLAREVYIALSEALKLTSSQQEALNRMQNSVTGNYDESMHRNNIFKAAHSLGIRLPSMSF